MEEETIRIVAEAPNGSFCLLPRHVDFVTALIPGVMIFEKTDGDEDYVALDEGILVKIGQNVFISTRNAVLGADLGRLRDTIDELFLELDERERTARSALADLEADFVRRFIEMKI